MRRTILLLGAMLAALVVGSGVAWAATTIRCPNDPLNVGGGTCWGTEADDVVIGTDGRDRISAGYDDDIVRVGPDLITSYEDDYWFGEDENHGGPGADYIVGQLDSEKHFGGRGDDTIVDYKSGKNPNVFRCGAGRDEMVAQAVWRLRAGETLMPLEEVVELLRYAGSRREEEYEARQAIEKLSPREIEVLEALAEGWTARG